MTQDGLVDARLAGDDHRSRLGGRRQAQVRPEPCQFAVPSHDRRRAAEAGIRICNCCNLQTFRIVWDQPKLSVV
jgi:hypothetical protein